eukprot:4502017-Amphidinium_carterae.1
MHTPNIIPCCALIVFAQEKQLLALPMIGNGTQDGKSSSIASLMLVLLAMLVPSVFRLPALLKRLKRNLTVMRDNYVFFCQIDGQSDYGVKSGGSQMGGVAAVGRGVECLGSRDCSDRFSHFGTKSSRWPCAPRSTFT